MLVQITEYENTAIAKVSGVINAQNGDQFQSALAGISSEYKLVIDFKDVDYITSMGLRVLLIERKKRSESGMLILNVSEIVYEVLETTGMTDVLDITRAKKEDVDLDKVSIKDLLKEKVSTNGDDIAFVVSDGTNRAEYTYKQIDLYSSIIAMDLRKKGVKKGTHVGLAGTNTANWIFAFFAVQKLGGIAFLINFNLGTDEIHNITKVGKITHLCYGELTAVADKELMVKQLLGKEDPVVREVYCFDDSVDLSTRVSDYCEAEMTFNTYVDYDDEAVVIFTSGSTGNPKAVMLSAYNLLSSAKVTAEHFHVGSSDIYCQVLPMFHLFGLCFGMLGNMIANAKIVIPKNIRTGTIINVIDKERCTELYSIPTLLFAISASGSFEVSRLDTIRCIMMGGAGVTVAQMEDLQSKFRNAAFCSIYGQSEMAPVTLTPYGDTAEHVAVTIGKPVNNVQAKIIDIETGAECENGRRGELVVKGKSTMVGYYHILPEDQPFDDEGWLHTGDLAVKNDDGYITLIGRTKEMIKKGGENIAPAEIAEQVSRFPGVSDVKVVGIKDDFYTETVGVGVVMKNGAQLDKDALIDFLSRRLAKYKVPSYVFRYDAFPTLANGKVDAVTLKKDMNIRAEELKEQ